MSDVYPSHNALHLLEDQLHAAWPPSRRNDHPCVPAEHEEAIAGFLSNVIAELVESYLDAGSERDAIREAVFPQLLDEISGWTERD